MYICIRICVCVCLYGRRHTCTIAVCLPGICPALVFEAGEGFLGILTAASCVLAKKRLLLFAVAAVISS